MSASIQRRSTVGVDGWGQKSSEPPREWTLRMVDMGFACLILLLPFVWGGRQALGHLTVVLLAGWTASWWAIHQIRSESPRWRFSGAEPLFLLAIALVALQTVALPESLKSQLSPQINRLLVGWTEKSGDFLGIGPWSTLSFVPWQTWSDLVTLVAVMSIFFIAVQRLETASDVHRILRWVSLSGCLTGAFGVLQYLTSNGMFYWFYEHPDTTTDTAAKAAFTNANHFADFLAMALPAQLWWCVTNLKQFAKWRDARNMNHPVPDGWRGILLEWGPVLFFGITACALVLSQSRGGLLAAGVGLSLVSLMFWRQQLFDSRIGLCLLVAGAVATGCVFLFGKGLEKELTENIESMSDGTVEEVSQLNSRREIWLTDWKVIQDFPATGTGLGSHRYVYHTYFDYPADGAEFTHAENGYLQVAMETGVTGLALAVLSLMMALYWCLNGLKAGKNSDVAGPAAVALSVLAINLTHSVTDFIWYVPGCMVIFVLFMACAFTLFRTSGPNSTKPVGAPLGRLGWGVSFAAVVAGLVWGIQIKWPEVAAEPHYLEYRRLANSESSDNDVTQFEIEAILKAAQANPHDPEIQNRAARAWLRTFLFAHQKEHELSLEEIQQAAVSSEYTSRKELNAWLDNPDVIGKNRKYLQRSLATSLSALRLSPLDDRPYLNMARLAWMMMTPVKREDALLKQALQVRPYDGVTHLEVAHMLLNRGEVKRAEAHYRVAFKQDERCRRALIEDLAPHVAAEFFLNNFQMDRRTLANLRAAYKDRGDAEGYTEILERLAKAEVEASQHSAGELAASHLVTAHGCYAELGDEDRALEILEKNVKRFSSSFNLRINLANSLYDYGHFKEALPHLEWCHRRQPENESIAVRIENAMKNESRINVAEEDTDAPRVR